MNRFFNTIFCCLFFFAITSSIRSEGLTLSQDDIVKLQSILEQTKQNNLAENKKEQERKVIEDKNFKLITETRDQINETLQTQFDVLIQKPDWHQKVICDILSILTSSEYYKDAITDFNLFKDFGSVLDDISKSYSKFFKELRTIIDIFRVTDYLTKKERGFFEKIQSFPNSEIMSESSITDELNNLLSPLTEYAPNSSKTLIRNLITKAVKTKFGTEPRVPSYVVFGILSCLNEALTDQFEKLETIRKQFLRNLDSLIDITNELLKEIKNIKNSTKIAPNIIIYLECFEKCLQEINDENQNVKKDFNEYTEKISTLYSGLSKNITDCLDSPKNPEIFDYLDRN